ncbi:unnamed protein product [Clavelina lepadiformis]|uniref:RGS domain-containing protein n=1 Tax=Clavelina lepadiformis TaxID=159417 RepID=A0ABP0H1A2_CLALP
MPIIRRSSDFSTFSTKFQRSNDNDFPKTASFCCTRKALRNSNTGQMQTKQTSDMKVMKVVTLRMILNNKQTYKIFEQFLEDEHSDENLEFWSDVNTFREESTKKKKKHAQKIYSRFIKESSKREVNLDFSVRKQMERDLKTCEAEIFDDAQEIIFQLMDKGSFIRFKNSSKFRKCEVILHLSDKDQIEKCNSPKR